MIIVKITIIDLEFRKSWCRRSHAVR